jgi:hypothetical protein
MLVFIIILILARDGQFGFIDKRQRELKRNTIVGRKWKPQAPSPLPLGPLSVGAV